VTERGPSPLSLGEIIRRQRELAELPMRQLAAMVGISNPYLSQIEHGLRDPSEQVLEGIARSLQTSVDQLLDAAGSGTDKTNGAHNAVLDAVRADPNLTARQRHALSEVYTAMTEATATRRSQRRRSG
jgi:transcriptional regulator with XRE-family HTH domain